MKVGQRDLRMRRPSCAGGEDANCRYGRRVIPNRERIKVSECGSTVAWMCFPGRDGDQRQLKVIVY